MAELKDRETDEQRMMAILLLLFQSEPMGFWLGDIRSPQFFADRIRELGLEQQLLDVSIRARETLLKEIRVDIDRIAMDRQMRKITEFYRYDLANRLSQRHEEWRRQAQQEARDRAARRAAGEVAPEPRMRQDMIYTEADARREAASAITDWVSRTEFEVAEEIAAIHGKTLEAVWKTEADPCPVCLEMSGRAKEYWGKKFPRGPKAHPNCVLPESIIQTPFGLTASMQSHYRGSVRDICVGMDRMLSVTSQHPIETPSGPVEAAKLRAGDLVYVADGIEDCSPCSAERLHKIMVRRADGETLLVPPKPSHLHGEGQFIQCPIKVAGKPVRNMNADDPATIRLDLAMKRRSIKPRIEAVTFNSSRQYDGLVYDFSAEHAPFYVADGVFVANCRCWLEWREVMQD